MRYIKIVLFTLVLSTICGILLTGMNIFTKERITKYEQFVLYSSVLEALGMEYSRENVEEIFKDNVTMEEVSGITFYRSEDGAVAFEVKGPGLWGPIKGLVSLEPDLATIRRLLILHQEETPGLGGRIEEEEFLSQFRGKKVIPRIVFLPEGKAKAPNEVDAITGATGSSRALEKLLNEEIQKAVSIIKNRKS